MATLKWSRGNWVCSRCFMRQDRLRPYCIFCEAEFTNYEEITEELWLDSQKDK